MYPETPLVILIKKQHQTKKKKKTLKKCALDLPRIRFAHRPSLKKSGDVVGMREKSFKNK